MSITKAVWQEAFPLVEAWLDKYSRDHRPGTPITPDQLKRSPPAGEWKSGIGKTETVLYRPILMPSVPRILTIWHVDVAELLGMTDRETNYAPWWIESAFYAEHGPALVNELRELCALTFDVGIKTKLEGVEDDRDGTGRAISRFIPALFRA